MKPPTVSELRAIAADHHIGADFHWHQLTHSRLTDDEKATERRLYRGDKLIALACERWAEQIDARTVSPNMLLGHTAEQKKHE